jgi:hypothetical protein
MYNRDMSILYYSSSQQIDFIRQFKISHFTFTKHLNKGTYYLGKYLFLREPVLTAKVSNLNDKDLYLLLEKDRVKYNKYKPLNSLSKAIEIKEISTNKVLTFPSLGKCMVFFKEKGLPASQTTINKRIKDEKQYNGYFCRYVNNS